MIKVVAPDTRKVTQEGGRKEERREATTTTQLTDSSGLLTRLEQRRRRNSPSVELFLPDAKKEGGRGGESGEGEEREAREIRILRQRRRARPLAFHGGRNRGEKNFWAGGWRTSTIKMRHWGSLLLRNRAV